MRRGIGPMLPGFHHFSYPQCAKCPWHEKPESCSLACLEEIKTAFSLYLPPDEVAAVIIEPIGGDIGLVVPPARWVRELAALCREHSSPRSAASTASSSYRTRCSRAWGARENGSR